MGKIEKEQLSPSFKAEIEGFSTSLLDNTNNITKILGLGYDNKSVMLATDIDFNNVVNNGLYSINSTSTSGKNAPNGAGLYSLISINTGTDLSINTQIAIKKSETDPPVYIRYRVNGTWLSWKQLPTTESITFPTLLNGWTKAIGDMNNTCIKNGNEVTINASIIGGTSTENTVIFNLPSGYRPCSNILVGGAFNWSDRTKGYYFLNVRTNGDVTLRTTAFNSTDHFILNFSFPIEGVN